MNYLEQTNDLQIPFAIYDVAREKRWIRNGFLPQFDFYGDKMIAFLLASGVGFGFGVTFEFKKAFGDFFSDKANQFLNKSLISTGLLLLGFVFMALLSIFSSIPPSTSSSNKKYSFFG
ncbi:hypothetical protein ACJIZ3_004406 [Penstemon smallii]|uniref:Uncharacterized protein n=1 Tax=Penstemon smallii TaxID=265156 RepID=A0ABD3S276_9LAMI